MFPSARTSQVHKARVYAEQPERFHLLHPMQVVFEGDHRNHVLEFRKDRWHCDCAYAAANDLPCKHIMALEMLIPFAPGSGNWLRYARSVHT